MVSGISKSFVAFFIVLEMFTYQWLCLFGSGFEEANRILICSGLIVALYFAFTFNSWKHIRRTFVLSFIVATLLVTWILRTAGLHECGTAGGNGLFLRDFFAGDVTYCMDVLFHSTIVEAIKNYNTPSTLMGSIDVLHYHVGADWVMAGIAKFTGLSGVAMIGYVNPMLFLPLVSTLVILAIQKLRTCWGYEAEFSSADALFLLLFLLMPGFVAPLFVYFIHSETCLLGSIFFLVALSLLPQLEAAIPGSTMARRGVILFLLIPFLIIGSSFSKISAGFSFVAILGGFVLWEMKCRGLRKSMPICLMGLGYLLLFGSMYLIAGRDQTPVMSSNYLMHILDYGFRCVCHPLTTVFLLLPFLAFLFIPTSPAGARIRFACFFATVASYAIYVLLRVHGGSEIYFWVNAQMLILVYFIAIGLPHRCVKFLMRPKWRFLLPVCICVLAFSLFKPIGSALSVIHEAYSQPKPDTCILNSRRYCDMKSARRFVCEKGPRNVMAYVTEEYWTERSAHDRMAKAYILAVQAYLGVPAIGTIKSDSRAIYVRKNGEWAPIGLPASYFLDRYLKSPIPEYSLQDAKMYAKNHGCRYLLVCGSDDSVVAHDLTN